MHILTGIAYPRGYCIQFIQGVGTSSKAQFTLRVRSVGVYVAKAIVLMGILFILLYWGFETSLMWQKLIFSLVD